MDFGFLTDKEIKEQGPELLGEYFDEEQAEGASYDLSLGEEVYISGQDYPQRLSKSNPFVSLPRGQFALLMTKEYVMMPKDHLGFISIRFGKKAQGLIKNKGTASVPMHLRNAPTQLMKKLDYGKNYEYPHDHPEHFIDVDYFPENVTESFYKPTILGYEKYISERLSKLWPSRFNK